MIDYLSPKDGPVFAGLEHKEVVYAKDQPEYIPLRTLVSAGPDRKVLSRWTLTDKQRLAVVKGADIFLELSTFGRPLQPIRLMISDGSNDDDCPMDTDWIKVMLLDEKVEPLDGLLKEMN